MAQIVLDGVSFGYDGGEDIFSNLDLVLDTGWKLGLVGRNGRGKTTLLKILAGELVPRGRVSVPHPLMLFPYRYDPLEDGRALMRRARPGLEAWTLEREAGLMGLDSELLGRPAGILSGGERTKLMLCMLFLEEGDFPLIDEPTAGLDLEGRKAVAGYLAAKRGFVLASHDRTVLAGAADHMLAINRQGVELVRGGYGAWEEARRRKDAEEEARAERLSREIGRLRGASERSSRWAAETEKGKFGQGPVNRGFVGHKAAKMQKRAKAVADRRSRAAEEKASMARNVEIRYELSMSPARDGQRRLAEAGGLSCGYLEGRPVAEGVAFTIDRGSRTALAGPNGSGKSLVLRLLSGENLWTEGVFRRAPGIRVSCVPQEPAFVPSETLRDLAQAAGADEGRYKAVLRHLGFPADRLSANAADLSRGQQKKALLGLSLCSEAHLYLWDEPLDHVDLMTRMQLEELIDDALPTLVVVEHDLAFLERLGFEVLDMGSFSARRSFSTRR
ncbi:MAG: ATP-binding cassette domain-containing protein [Deltaproteobacteria bacterium]|jgi:lincosamide and streptogramin A transport system ATP-binding/permease protein|nr:ATP-binding cassette domain-containing protein [Deltaproteobacteria bacterium]